MKIAGIDFPKPLLDAMRDGRLVVFAGAGVSMGEPASLPSFSKLAEAIAYGTGEVFGNGELEDQFLGRLQHKGVLVHARSAEELSKHDPRPTALHYNLLRLFSEPASTRVVTTNFDLLFERAAEKLFESRPDVFTAPALPLGSRFNGIVHVHGSLDRENDMVLTDSDFGRAYLIEGWARRFLVDLFWSYTVLFVGYSHNDTVMNYLSRALPTETQRFALADASAFDRWQPLGIEPVFYSQSSSSDHSSLYDGIHGFANYVSRGILDWQQEITETARNSPPLDDEASDLIHAALADPTRARFFTSAASHPDWIGWLERSGHLDNLFRSGLEGITEQDSLLARWLAERFAHAHAEHLFHLIARRNLYVHRELWIALGHTIGFGEDQPLAPGDLARWVSLLIATAPPTPRIVSANSIMRSLGKRCAAAGLTDSLLEIFTMMTTVQLEVRSILLPVRDSGTDTESFLHTNVEPDFGYSDLGEFWRLRLKPQLDRVAEPLLAIVVQNLMSQFRVLGAWQSANRDWDSATSGRSAIEPHEQDRHPDPTGVVIDVARDCLEHLALTQKPVVSDWCDWLVRDDVPILRRLSVHTLCKRKDLDADEKIEWLLDNIGLHDLAAHHETFQAMRVIYPSANSEKRKAVIDAVSSFEWPDTEDEDSEQLTAHRQFSWLHWLHESDTDCELVKQSLHDIRQRYPNFQPQEHPDLTVYTTGSMYVETQAPWSVSELLARPPKDWVGELLSFKGKGFLGPNRAGLLNAVEETASEDFEWAMDLADALADSGDWDADLWPPLIRAWSREFKVDKHRKALGRLKNDELYPMHARPVADALRVLVKDGGLPYAAQLLTEANEIAIALWDGLDRTEPIERGRNWLFRAINHPAGVLTEFWLHSLLLWQRQQETRPDSLADQYNLALSKIIQDATTVGTLGKAVIASQSGYILAADENWAKQYLIPLFDSDDGDDRQGVWQGFLYGSLNPQVADSMKNVFLTAVSSMGDLFPEHDDLRRRFVTLYAWMVTYFVDQPLDVWIPKFFESAEPEDKRRFAWALGGELNRMDDGRQHEWWERWLMRFWEKRLQGIPVPLDAGEVEEMLGWLPYLDRLFPKAVDLVIQMPQTPLERNSTIDEMNDGDLPCKYPRATAKLLVHLADCDSPQWAWHDGKELIDRLLRFDLPIALERELKELLAKLGLSTESA